MVFAVSAPADMSSGLLEGAKALGGALDFSGGMALSATVAFADATMAMAKAKADELTERYQGLKELATGIPQPVLDSVTVEAKDATVVSRLVADRHDGTSLVGTRNERSWRWHGSNGASAACRTVVVC